MKIVQYGVGFIAGLADSFCSLKTRNRIFRSAAYTRHTLDGFDLGCDICSIGRRIRGRIFR